MSRIGVVRIYTRTGDDGTTGLVQGIRVSKDSSRVDAYGNVDELNSLLGLVRSYLSKKNDIDSVLLQIQNDLFTIGTDLATVKDGEALRITNEHVLNLERTIDKFQEELPPLKVFILPSGTNAAASLHFARSVARRAERKIVTLGKTEKINRQLVPYLNRLSDLLFVLARLVNYREGNIEVQWHSKP